MLEEEKAQVWCGKVLYDVFPEYKPYVKIVKDEGGKMKDVVKKEMLEKGLDPEMIFNGKLKLAETPVFERNFDLAMHLSKLAKTPSLKASEVLEFLKTYLTCNLLDDKPSEITGLFYSPTKEGMIVQSMCQDIVDQLVSSLNSENALDTCKVLMYMGILRGSQLDLLKMC